VQDPSIRLRGREAETHGPGEAPEVIGKYGGELLRERVEDEVATTIEQIGALQDQRVPNPEDQLAVR
jgi:hypothetical protein